MKVAGTKIETFRTANFFLPLLLLGLVGFRSVVTAQSLGTFTATGTMTADHAFATATLLTNGKVLIVGKEDGSAELYDPDTGTFMTAGNITAP